MKTLFSVARDTVLIVFFAIMLVLAIAAFCEAVGL